MGINSILDCTEEAPEDTIKNYLHKSLQKIKRLRKTPQNQTMNLQYMTGQDQIV